MTFVQFPPAHFPKDLHGRGPDPDQPDNRGDGRQNQCAGGDRDGTPVSRQGPVLDGSRRRQGQDGWRCIAHLDGSDEAIP